MTNLEQIKSELRSLDVEVLQINIQKDMSLKGYMWMDVFWFFFKCVYFSWNTYYNKWIDKGIINWKRKFLRKISKD